MAKTAEDVVPDPLSDGWASLTAGEWEEARDFFSAAVGAEETPEALEGLSWASWWLDDAESVFSTRERAYQLYRLAGDPRGAARMATWIAADELDFHGAARVAQGWLQRARRLLDSVAAGPDHGWLAFHEGYAANMKGDLPKAEDMAIEAAECGERFGVPDLEILGLALQGAVLVSRAEVEEGMRCLDEATAAALAREALIPISSAWACCFMVGACTEVLDYPRAFEWCDRIRQFAQRYGSRYMLAFCRAEYGAIYLWRGQWDDAEEMLEASVEDFTKSRPGMVETPIVGLAELRRRQGRAGEALSLLDRVGPSSSAQLCRARLALDKGDPRRAVELVQRLLRKTPAERKVNRAAAYVLLVRSLAADGDLESAGAALESLREIEQLVGTEPMRAWVELAEGVLDAAGGDHDRARVRLEDAVDRFLRVGAPFEAAQARVELAESMGRMGRTELAEREANLALDELTALGAKVEAGRARTLLDGLSENRPDNERPKVTRREREVLRLVAEGLSNRQIAEVLVVSEHTVHRHVTNILRKLGLPSRAAAAAHAVRSGLLES